MGFTEKFRYTIQIKMRVPRISRTQGIFSKIHKIPLVTQSAYKKTNLRRRRFNIFQ